MQTKTKVVVTKKVYHLMDFLRYLLFFFFFQASTLDLCKLMYIKMLISKRKNHFLMNRSSPLPLDRLQSGQQSCAHRHAWAALSNGDRFLRTGNVSSKVIHSISRLDVYQFIGDSRDFCYGTFLIKTPDSSFLLKKMMSSCSLLRSR